MAPRGKSNRKVKMVRAKRPYKTKSKGTTSISQAVKTYVKRTIHRQIENKEIQIDSGGNFGNYLNDNTLGAYPLMPLLGYWTVSQNVNSAGRVGNELNIRKVMLSYVLRPMIYNVTTNPFGRPCEVEMFLGYVKRTPSVRPTATDFQSLFQNGNTSVPPTGGLNDINSDINTDYWCIKKRWRHKIGYSTTANSVSSGQVASQQTYQFSNNDFKLNVVRKMDITKFIPIKRVKFNDGDGTSYKNLFLFYYCLAADGIIMTSVEEPIHLDFQIRFTYEDA